MKITVEISDELFERAKKIAQMKATTVGELIDEGLRQALESRRQPRAFELRDASVDGDGLVPEFCEGSWERLRAAIYQGRGG